jgi:hypothetical protein
MGAKTADRAVNIQLPRYAAGFAGETLKIDLVVRNVIPGATLESAAFGQAYHTVLRMKSGVHALNNIANQGGLVIQLAKSAQDPVAVGMACQGEVFTTPDTVRESRAADLVLDGATSGDMIASSRSLVVNFHSGSGLAVAKPGKISRAMRSLL